MAFAQTIEFRFKLPEISSTTPLSQSLLVNRTGSTNTSTQFGVYLEYTGSLSSGSYSGSVVDPYYQYGTLKFIYPEANASASIYLPFLNGDWWSVMVTRNDDPYITYDLYAASKTLNEYGQYVVQYQGSSSLTTSFDWKKPGNILIPGSGSSTILGKTYVPATGSFQELRYYNIPLSESQFNDYVVNSNSIEGNTLDSSYDELFFRAALGGELFTGSTSIHPAVNTTPSFDSGNSNFSYTGSYSFNSNTEINYYDQVPSGIKNAISQKIQQQNIVLPYSSSKNNIPNSNVLSPFISVQQSPSISQSYTRDIDYVEVGFSPQNEINEDINDQLGYFNIGEFIGDPRQVSSSADSYPDLNVLRDSYFRKYSENYQEWDYIRLIQFFDNSLFKTVADWVPARASLASGIIIKQHLLERNKYPVPQAEISTSIANVASGSTNIPFYQENILFTGSVPMGTITGSDGGTLPNMNGQTSSVILPGNYNTTVTQVWSGSNSGPLGIVPFTDSYQTEFFDGELSGSVITVTTQSLTSIQDYLVLINNASSSRLSEKYFDVDYSQQNILPVNQQVILSQSATYAQVQDSNYTLASNINPRYVGSKNTSAKYNTYTVGDSSYGKKAAIDTYVKYFAYFDYMAARSTYIGGSNIHIINLIDIEGNIITLTPENKNLFDIEQIFKQGDPVYAYQVNGTSVTTLPEMTIVTGGALYTTVLVKSGSGDINNAGLTINADVIYNFPNIYFISGSNPPTTSSLLLNNSIVQNPNFLDFLITGSNFSNVTSYTTIGTPGLIQIFNKSEDGLRSGTINVEDTLFPIQYGDFIRFGNSTTTPPSLDTNWDNGNLYQIITTNPSNPFGLIPYPVFSSSLQVTPAAHSYPQFGNLLTNAISSFDINNNYNQFISVGSSSFNLNGITINYTGSNQPNLFNQINININGLGNSTNAADFTETTLNFSSSVAPYDSFLQYILTQNAGSTLNFNTTLPIGTPYQASILNSYYVTSGSINTVFSGATNVGNQAFRIIRRVPNETFVVINQSLGPASGLLVPYNFDPDYSPAEIAKKAGLIQ
jgi:hypothetical protein